MRKIKSTLGILIALLVFPPLVPAANIIYNIKNRPGVQNGWTLTGTIVTDGTIGAIKSTDIVSWTYTLMAPAGGGAFTYSSALGGFDLLRGTVMASASAIYLPAPAGNAINSLHLFGAAPAGQTDYDLAWRYLGPGTRAPGAKYSAEYGIPPNGVNTEAWLSNNPPLDPGNLIIATVPEPSSVVLATFGLGGAILFARARRRRAAHVNE